MDKQCESSSRSSSSPYTVLSLTEMSHVSADQRMEEACAHEQAEDFARQEKILKLISTEPTRNTTRVVEMAMKNEVQNSVLPSLENIMKMEVKSALNDQSEGVFRIIFNRSVFPSPDLSGCSRSLMARS